MINLRYKFTLLSLFLFGYLLFSPWQAALAACHFFSAQVENGSYVLADNAGAIIASCNLETALVPASILKIPTSLASLVVLGSDYRFKTRFFMDNLDNLYIQGFGDPMLTSEEVSLILKRLQARGVKRIKNIIIDNSAYELDSAVPGAGNSANPYDAPVSSLAVNFNTVSFRVNPGGGVISNEPQTPDLPLMKDLAVTLGPGVYRVNVASGGQNGAEATRRYVGELFRGLQRRLDIVGDGILVSGVVADNAKLVYEHLNSRSLGEIIRACLRYSNNFIANQLYLACGAAEYGYPATWEKGRLVVGKQLDRLLGPEYSSQIYMVEGSGLSRQNRVTAGAMLQVLKLFRPYMKLLPEKQGNLIKSGTLSDVFSYAGYLAGRQPFVIILNQQDNLRERILAQMTNFSANSAKK